MINSIKHFLSILDNQPFGMALLDTSNNLFYSNQLARQYLDMSIKNGENISNFLKIITAKKSLTYTLRQKKEDITLQIKYEYLEDLNIGSITFLDISEKIKLHYITSFYEEIINQIDEGVHALDSNGHTIIYNKSLEELEGYSKYEVLGKHITEIHNVSLDSSIQLNVLKSGESTCENEVIYYTRTGKKITVLASTHPVKINGSILGVFSTSKDITAMKKLTDKTMYLQSQLVYKKKQKTKSLNNPCKYTFDSIIHGSSSINNIIQQSKRAAKTSSSLMIFGETGTGKELFIQSIHNASSRNNEPFIAINCAAIPLTLLESMLFGTVKGAYTGAVDTTGLLQQAGHGTLFLDEINSMPTQLQAKLLRVLQEKLVRRVGGNSYIPINCRIVSSTNIDPLNIVETGGLRKDLFYRLAVVLLTIPPLRERQEDIPLLCKHFLQKYNNLFNLSVTNISPELMNLLIKYKWPGNVRELEHVIENAMNMVNEKDKCLGIKHLPSYFLKYLNINVPLYTSFTSSKSLPLSLIEYEKQIIENALALNNGNISKTADYLGIFRQGLQRRIKKLNIVPKKFSF